MKRPRNFMTTEKLQTLWTENLINFPKLARLSKITPDNFLHYYHPRYRYRIERKPFLNERVRYNLYEHYKLISWALSGDGLNKEKMVKIQKDGLLRFRKVGKRMGLGKDTFHRYYYEPGTCYIQNRPELKANVELILSAHKIILEWVLGLD